MQNGEPVQEMIVPDRDGFGKLTAMLGSRLDLS